MATSGSKSCGICKIRHKTSEAHVWCPECEDAMCSGCSEHHSISKGTRHHTAIPIEDYMKLPPFILDIVKLFCEEHNEKFQNYCLNHKQPLCKKCIVAKHKDCKDISTMDEVTLNAKTSVTIETIEENIVEVLQKIKELKQNRQENLDKINQQKTDVIQEISKVRNELNTHLDKIEREALSELSSVVSKAEANMKDLLKVLKSKDESLTQIKEAVSKIKMYASDFQTFIGIQNIAEKLSTAEKFLQLKYEDGGFNQIEIMYSMEGKIKSFTSACSTFCRISTNDKLPTVKLGRRSNKGAQIPSSSIAGIHNKRVKLNCRIPNSKKNVTGGCVMTNGDIVLACFTNKKLEIYGNNGAFKFELPVNSSDVFDVTQIDDRTVGVSGGFSKTILIVDIDKRKHLRTINIAKNCSGITYKEGCLIYLAQGQGLCQLDLKSFNSTLIYSVDIPLTSYVTTADNKICFTNYKTKTVTALDFSMKKVWEVRDENLYPHGVAGDGNNIFVADKKANDILGISSDGKQFSRLQCDGVELYAISGLFYDKNQIVLL